MYTKSFSDKDSIKKHLLSMSNSLEEKDYDEFIGHITSVKNDLDFLSDIFINLASMESLPNINAVMTAIQCGNNYAYGILMQKGAKLHNDFLTLALQICNYDVVNDLIDNHFKKLDLDINSFLLDNCFYINEEILEVFCKAGVTKDCLENLFIMVIHYFNDTNLDKALISKGIDIKNVFSKIDNIFWNRDLVRKYAIDINHECSEILKVLAKDDCSSEEYKACFDLAKEIKLNYKNSKSDVEKIMHFIFEKAGINFIKYLFNVTHEDEHKDLVKWLTIFGAKFSFYNSDETILKTQDRGNELKGFLKNCDGNLIHTKKLLKTNVVNGKLFNDITGEVINSNPDQSFLYVIDKKGQLYINNTEITLYHSYILNGFNQKHKLDGISLLGYGKPVACGGYMSLVDGSIVAIKNDSGHHTPDTNMLKNACKNLLLKGVLSQDVKISYHTDYTSEGEMSLSDIENFDVKEVLGDYIYVDY